jgi:pectin methylesterase-like acyl-CoA thioesterase
MPPSRRTLLALPVALLLWSACNAQGRHRAGPTLHVSTDPSADYKTVQSAIDQLGPDGGTVLIAPGTYRGQVIINQSNVTLKGTGPNPDSVVVVDDTSQGTRGSKPSYATVHVMGDDFHARNLTFENDFNRTHEQAQSGSQAQALNLEGDRNILTSVRILGNQDTLYIGARGCGQAGSLRTPPPSSSSYPASTQATPAPHTPCTPAPNRSYFDRCLVTGNVDFIYGDGNAVFHDCEIRNTLHAAGGYITAQGKYQPAQQSTFVFDHCHLTAEPGQAHVFLGRPWRPYASVVYLHCHMDAHIEAVGWREWHPGETHNLDTVYYAEYQSTGPGANPAAREPHSHQLTAEQARQYDAVSFLAGPDRWNPTK